jgi:hypothetical protein
VLAIVAGIVHLRSRHVDQPGAEASGRSLASAW